MLTLICIIIYNFHIYILGQAETENLDYVYAAVQKKTADSTKHLNTYNDQKPYVPPLADRNYDREMSESPHAESNSDNTGILLLKNGKFATDLLLPYMAVHQCEMECHCY